ncbi:preprotein translocase subunit SecG [Methylobacter sp. S3L5C]|uniref:preprotein translocase subunit SecG n=1 Tax=Methylobacter sp. S3L5C TaxID=2839024 RepID=UPI001FABBD3F|nr:preprotein translocase subunit SecG [Methylobacter sp. S3L5C]UOA08945.1 preprotein translocase subunit SecG [Methylobacter sp. S3L5C]
MYQVIIVIHVLLGLGIIGLILMQQGKGADAGAAFGTGSAGSVFGAQGAASFLSRATAILATLFFITSLGLAMINGHKGVAFDLMSSPEVQQDTLGIPEVVGEKGANIAPAKSEEMPAVPEVKSAEQPADAELENTVVPKAEELKTIK